MSLQILEWPRFIEDKPGKPEPSAMTIGVFDGVHRGHAALINTIVRRGPFPTVVTFRENPKKWFGPEKYEGDIFTLDQKLAIFEELGVSRAILIDFSVNFSKLRGWEFVDLLESRGNLVFLAIGVNFRCGYRQDTDAEAIRKINEAKSIPTEVVAPVMEGSDPVSSSRVRLAVKAGDLALAARLLGRPVVSNPRGESLIRCEFL